MLIYLALLFAYKALNWLPTRAAYFIADCIGSVVYYLAPRLRSNAKHNMRQVMGPEASDKQVRRAARSSVRSAARYYADLVKTPRTNSERLYKQRVNMVSGLDDLREAIATKRGVIVASAHYANPEIVLQTAVHLGIPTFTLTEPLKPQRLSDLVHKLRSSQGQTFRPLSLSAVREAIRSLRQGKVVPLLCDRDIQNSGIVLPFFGAETRVPVGAAEIALRTGALVVPMFCRRTPHGGFDVFGEPPMEMTTTGDLEADVRTNTLRILAAIERCVRGDPGQWFVLESMWDSKKAKDPRQPVRHSQNRGV
jgi:lauroyl/myristoyl acyltransferase